MYCWSLHIFSQSEALVASLFQIKTALDTSTNKISRPVRLSYKTCCDKSLTLSDDKIGRISFGHTASIYSASMLSWDEDLHLLLHERIFMVKIND